MAPRTPRNTVKTNSLPKVGDEIALKGKVTRVAGDTITVRINANGQLSTAKADYLLRQDD